MPISSFARLGLGLAPAEVGRRSAERFKLTKERFVSKLSEELLQRQSKHPFQCAKLAEDEILPEQTVQASVMQNWIAEDASKKKAQLKTAGKDEDAEEDSKGTMYRTTFARRLGIGSPAEWRYSFIAWEDYEPKMDSIMAREVLEHLWPKERKSLTKKALRERFDAMIGKPGSFSYWQTTEEHGWLESKFGRETNHHWHNWHAGFLDIGWKSREARQSGAEEDASKALQAFYQNRMREWWKSFAFSFDKNKNRGNFYNQYTSKYDHGRDLGTDVQIFQWLKDLVEWLLKEHAENKGEWSGLIQQVLEKVANGETNDLVSEGVLPSAPFQLISERRRRERLGGYDSNDKFKAAIKAANSYNIPNPTRAEDLLAAWKSGFPMKNLLTEDLVWGGYSTGEDDYGWFKKPADEGEEDAGVLKLKDPLPVDAVAERGHDEEMIWTVNEGTRSDIGNGRDFVFIEPGWELPPESFAGDGAASAWRRSHDVELSVLASEHLRFLIECYPVSEATLHLPREKFNHQRMWLTQCRLCLGRGGEQGLGVLGVLE